MAGEGGGEGKLRSEKVEIICLKCATSLVYYPEHRLGSLTLPLPDHIVKPVGPHLSPHLLSQASNPSTLNNLIDQKEQTDTFIAHRIV